MLKSLYEIENEDRNIYDGVREYCMTERLNEECFRASMVQKGSKHKLVKIIADILFVGEKEKGYEKSKNQYPSILKNTR